MTTRRGLTVGCLALSALVIRAQTPPDQLVFRASTDLVTIDVAVRSNGQPVGNLGAKDFVLRDNGVAQTVEVAALEAVPVDITVMIDANEDDAANTLDLVTQARKIVALARPTDRVRVMEISTYVTDLVPAQAPAELRVPDLVGRGIPSASDGLAAALLRYIEPDRRHLIIALTNGIDAMSTLDPPTVRELARHSTATLFIAQVNVGLNEDGRTYSATRERAERERCRASYICLPPRPFWRPYDDEQFAILKEAAELTGGDLYLPGVFTNRTASAVFEKAFADYRRRYLLRYTPQGVSKTGWHDVTVTLPAYPAVEINARHGYAMDASAKTPEPAATATSASPERPAAPSTRATPSLTTIPNLTAAYDAGRYDDVVSALGSHPRLLDLIHEFQRAGNPWPANPRREAAFVLELAQAGLRSSNRDARDAALHLLDTEQLLLRDPLAPDQFERFWLWAALMVLEAANQPAAALSFADRAIARFPDEPRFVLARAVLSDQRRALDPLTPATTSAPFVKEVAALYDRAIALESTANEARLRKGRLMQRAGRDTDALALFDAMHDDAQDPGLTYLRHLFRGQALDALARADEAMAEYRAALAAVPDAQSARVGLMAGLIRQGNRADAEALAEQIQAATTTRFDPWWGYWLGDYRFYSDISRQLRDQR